MSVSQSRPAGRYGEDAPAWHRTAARALAVTMAALAVAWVVWAGWSAGSRPVNATIITYQVRDDATIDVTFDVSMDPGTRAQCVVEARNGQHAAVGSAVVGVPVSTQRRQRVQTQVRTTERSAAAVVRGCEVPGQP